MHPGKNGPDPEIFMTRSRFFVTGATGFIGQHLVTHLLTSGHEVILLVREGYDGKPLPGLLADLRPQLHLVYGDLRNYNLTVRAVREAAPTHVIHLAAIGVTDPFLPVQTALSHNLNGTLHLLRACFEKQGGVEQLIVARTPGERTAMNVYAASKAAAWQFCQMYTRTQEWPIIGGMVFQAYGPGQDHRALVPSAIAAACAGHDFPMTAGTQQRDWVHVNDVVNGFQTLTQATLAPGTTIELGTGQPHSVATVVTLIYQLVNRGGKPLIGALPRRPGEDSVQQANIAATLAAIGWQAQHTLHSGLAQVIHDGLNQ